ncbi:MAG: hypothetical protein JO299_07395, partial [Gammaproteobacteria bacterium]|nr:hypothetical protein [Gammaproteobacteria bacterium]
MRTATSKEPVISAPHESLSKGTRAALVVGLHVVLIYALATGLGIVKPPELLKPMEAVMVDASRATQPVKPVVMKPQMSQPSMEVPVPEPQPQIDVPVETAPPAATTTASGAAGSNAVADANLQVTG